MISFFIEAPCCVGRARSALFMQQAPDHSITKIDSPHRQCRKQNVFVETGAVSPRLGNGSRHHGWSTDWPIGIFMASRWRLVCRVMATVWRKWADRKPRGGRDGSRDSLLDPRVVTPPANVVTMMFDERKRRATISLAIDACS
jgi:hypothetical protein